MLEQTGNFAVTYTNRFKSRIAYPSGADTSPTTELEHVYTRNLRVTRKKRKWQDEVKPNLLEMMLSIGALHLVVDYSEEPYQAMIILSGVTKLLHSVITPSKASHRDKLAFVMKAERDFKKHRPSFEEEDETKENEAVRHSGNFGCYYCFRVLNPEYFPEISYAIEADASRRRCMECRKRSEEDSFAIKATVELGYFPSPTNPSELEPMLLEILRRARPKQKQQEPLIESEDLKRWFFTAMKYSGCELRIEAGASFVRIDDPNGTRLRAAECSVL